MSPSWVAPTVTAARSPPFVLCSSPFCGSSPLSRAYEVNWKKPASLWAKKSSRRRLGLALSKAGAAELPDDRSEARSPIEGEGEELSPSVLIWRAIKLPIYSVALVPLTVGSSAAYLQTGLFFGRRYFLLLAASVLIIAWLNLSNDFYDSITGVDQQKKESVVNMTGSREMVFAAASGSLALGIFGLVKACAESGDIRSVFLLAFSILCGYVYQCPPFRLGYRGLGEPLCFAAFGPFATTAFYLSLGGGGTLSGPVLCASLLVGLTTTLILFCSHFHQIEGDLAVGKMSPLVRIGTLKGSKIVTSSVFTLYALLIAFSIGKALPISCAFLCSLTLPVGKLVANFVEENHDDKVRIFMGKYYCVRLHALFGVSLALGLVLARRPGGFRFLIPL